MIKAYNLCMAEIVNTALKKKKAMIENKSLKF